MDPRYAQHYDRLYRQHWWWRAREDFLLTVLRARRPADGWNEILDVGCGDGLFFDRLQEFGRVEGVEPDGSLVDPQAAHAAQITMTPFDARFQPGKRYGLILLLDVLEHLPDPAGALGHALQLLEPQGLLLVTVPAFPLLWTRHDVMNQHQRRYTRTTLKQVALVAGVQVEELRYFFHWTFPAKLAQRLTEMVLHRAPRPARLPPVWLNRSLYWLSRREQLWVGGLGLPFGTSLLMVGRRKAETA